MNRKIAILLAGIVAINAYASNFSSVVTQADCKEIARSGSITGATVGGAVGAGLGAVAGRALFGKKGGLVGGLVGAGVGGYQGEKMMADVTYSCVVQFTNMQGQKVFAESLGERKQVGQTINVYPSGNTYLIK